MTATDIERTTQRPAALLEYNNPEQTGLPRPRNADGLPVPWVAIDTNDLASVDYGRWQDIASVGLCQVCGEPTTHNNRYAATPFSETGVWRPVLSGGLCHHACLLMALAHCPHLRTERNDLWRVPDHALRLWVPPEAGTATGHPDWDDAVFINTRLSVSVDARLRLVP